MTQVTAQDFLSEIRIKEYAGDFIVFNEGDTLKAWNSLLSKVRAQAHAEGRREGLKEMDVAWKILEENDPAFSRSWKIEEHQVGKLRQEYQQPN